MTTPRAKLILTSPQQADKLASQLASLIREEATLQLKLQEQLAQLRAQYSLQIRKVSDQIAELLPSLESWAAHSLELFGASRSLTMTDTVIGWRLGNPALQYIPPANEESVIAALRAEGLSRYIRTKESVAAAKLIADRAKLDPETLDALGVQIVQRDTFFVEPKPA